MNTKQTAIETDLNAMTAVLPLPDGSRVFAELLPDSDSAAPWEDWDGEGRVHIFQRGADVGAYLQEHFDADPEQVHRQLGSGELVKDIDANPALASRPTSTRASAGSCRAVRRSIGSGTW
ncbi:hypothetical protein U5801_11880 [Lamprobacter modestohalophilus]|uniref:hypothetical protein n=1 Tax=Lamprobacter modestohalophilus TaxID=1064514 RepID=UPI002ADEA717|nr:hypothetical protein [Lamprobacter modestohalophilus]MEA1050504.1 hypothetical protein [Lamprobacter modestohalophilus]